MRRVCEIVRCTLVWREMQACIHEGVHGQEVLLLSVQYVYMSLDIIIHMVESHLFGPQTPNLHTVLFNRSGYGFS